MLPDRTQPPAYAQTFNLDIKQAEHFTFGKVDLFAIHDRDQEVVKIEFIYPDAGSKMDSRKGESYFTWKMLSQGTTTRNAREIAESFDNYGGFIENSPSLDTSSFNLYCLTRHIDNLLPVLEDVIRNPSFPDDEFDLTREIVTQQLRIQNNRNEVVASRLFRQHLFGETHPYGQILMEEDLKNLNRDNLEKFYKAHGTGPDILISGDWKEHHLKQLAEIVQREKDDTIKALGLPPFHSDLKSYYDERPESLQSSIRIGKVTIPKSHPDYIPLRIACHALGGYFGSRLMKNIREEKGYTYGIHSSLISLSEYTYIVIGTDVQKEFYPATIDEIFKEIRFMSETPMPAEELRIVKNHMLGSFQSSITSPFALADKFKSIHYFGMNYDYYHRYIETIQSITADEIQRVIGQYLSPREMVSVIIG